MKNIDRMVIRKIENAFLVDNQDINYHTQIFSFPTWEEVVEFVSKNPIKEVDNG